VPEGYSLRTFVPGDERGWIDIIDSAFPDWDNETGLRNVLPHVLPDGMFLALDNTSGRPVATACAVHNPRGGHAEYPGGGELGYTATRPEHRGRGLGPLHVDLGVVAPPKRHKTGRSNDHFS
jgi:GNAT superfamily N-acetyltransferase